MGSLLPTGLGSLLGKTIVLAVTGSKAVIVGAGALAGALFAGGEAAGGFIGMFASKVKMLIPAVLKAALANLGVLGWLGVAMTPRDKTAEDEFAGRIDDIIDNTRDPGDRRDLNTSGSFAKLGQQDGEAYAQGLYGSLTKGLADIDWTQAATAGTAMTDAMSDGVKAGTPKLTYQILNARLAAAVEWGGMRNDQVAAVQDAMNRSIEAIQTGVVDMKDRIKTGKERFLEEVRLMAWQAKHPFAEKNYAEWLEERIDIGNRKMRRAMNRGREGEAAQWRQHIADLRGELMTLPNVAATAMERVIRAMAAIKTAAIDARMTIGNQYYDPLSGKLVDAFASGGRTSGGVALVGERGPELVSLPAGSYVHSNEDSRAMMAAAQPAGDMHLYIHTDDGQTHDLSAQLQRA
jgi:hypothetical protein